MVQNLDGGLAHEQPRWARQLVRRGDELREANNVDRVVVAGVTLSKCKVAFSALGQLKGMTCKSNLSPQGCAKKFTYKYPSTSYIPLH